MNRTFKHYYRLKLPVSMRCLHLVFHIVKLLPAPKEDIPGRHRPDVPPPEVVNGEERYKIEEILDSRIFQQKLQFLVTWKGYGYEENSWLNEEDVDAPELVQQFYQANPSTP
jgi:hypothetical protein